MCVGPEIMLAIQAGTMVAGGATALLGGKKQHDAQKDVTAASIRAEALRAQAMNIEAERKTREAIRVGQQTGAASLNAVASQTGSSAQGSSALAGARAQEINRQDQNTSYIGKQNEIGQGIFKANIDKATAEGRKAAGQGMFGLGTTLMGLGGPLGQLGAQLFGKVNTPGGTIGPWETTTTPADTPNYMF